jgi:hypothetical protein
MADKQFVEGLVASAANPEELLAAQHAAAQKLLRFDGERYPTDGCAITLSCLLQAAGIDVADTYLALSLGVLLERRGWMRVACGRQEKGDVGSTCGGVINHGTDHIFLVLEAMGKDEMVVADNQAPVPHFRYASGKGGKTPTKFFLRAPGAKS